MNAERYRQVQALFQAALERRLSERAAFLESVCVDDPSLRLEVEGLLESHREAAGFMEKPAFTMTAPSAAPEKRFGPYRVLRMLGQGGMGAVYLGARDDDQFNKRVALKVVQTADTEEILRRFRHERQILATLEHPNIARLLDGGTTEEGLPYFVMDYVEGISLLEFCDRRRLSIHERLKLFRTICLAVQYVHQNLVVHRDLKPSNILVTPEGVPKLLDFGIAKLLKPELLTSAQDATRVEMQLMTPGYASPEQVRGEPIATTSDVYSLGVILFELLTGCRPYRWTSKSPLEIARTVCEQEASKPSEVFVSEQPSASGVAEGSPIPAAISHNRATTPERLRRQLAGDLDNIVLMAIRKEPQRRYASAGHLAEEIERHLGGLPVLAHTPTLRYWTGKFIRRHRAGVAAAILVAASLVAGLVSTAWQASVARAERARAERRFNDVRRLANSFLFEFHDAIQNLPGSTPARGLVVRRALEYLDSLAKESAGDAGLRWELAQAYQKVGDVQGNPLNPNLGDTAAAQASFRKAIEILESLVLAEPGNGKAREALAEAYQKVADTQVLSGELKSAAESGRKSLALYESVAAQSRDLASRRLLAVSYLKLGDLLGNPGRPSLGDTAAARSHYQRAETMLQELRAALPADPEVRSSFLGVTERIGILLEREGKLSEAESRYATALKLARELALESPNNARRRRAVAAAEARMGNIGSLKREFGPALRHFEEAVKLAEELASADPSAANARRDVASVYGMMGECLQSAGDRRKAEGAYRKALAIVVTLATKDPKNTTLPKDVAAYQELIASLQKR